jgi:catechol 2,3-dioxygenase-like lactoylglutathione lyase family enzyme
MHVGLVIAVSDLSRAREFYEGALGLAGAETPGGRMRAR